MSERFRRQAEEAERVASQLSLVTEREALMRFARNWRQLEAKAREQESRSLPH